MKVTHILTALLLSTGAAMAQGSSPQDLPGGNLPTSQSPCARGYEDGVRNLAPETTRRIDSNRDGVVSKQEFDNACAKKLFDQQDNQG